MEAETRPAVRVTAKEIRAIEEIIRRRNQAEIKVEQGQIVSLRFGARRLTDCLAKSAAPFAEEPHQMV